MTVYLDFLHDLKDEVSDRLLYYFHKRAFSVTEKQNTSPVTEADLEIEQLIRNKAMQAFPTIALIGEEYEQYEPDKHATTKLIIDPIDATANFIRGVPIFATLLAFETDSIITDAMIIAPAIHATWWASETQGAFYNHEAIHVSSVAHLADACAFHGTLYGYEATGLPAGAQRLLSQTKRQRGFGDFYAPMLVAMGCGECSFDTNLACWDMAPIKLIIEEAGGTFTDFSGNPSIYHHEMLCSNSHVHDACLGYLNG